MCNHKSKNKKIIFKLILRSQKMKARVMCKNFSIKVKYRLVKSHYNSLIYKYLGIGFSMTLKLNSSDFFCDIKRRNILESMTNKVLSMDMEYTSGLK